MINKLIFVSFNKQNIYVYYPVNNLTKKLSFQSVNNLLTQYTLITFNKKLLLSYCINNNQKINNTTNIKDILSLYAIIFPVKWTTESINDLAKMLNITVSECISLQAQNIYEIYQYLINSLLMFDIEKQQSILAINDFMNTNNSWEWFNILNQKLQHVVIKSNNLHHTWKYLNCVEPIDEQTVDCDQLNIVETDLIMGYLEQLTAKFGNITKEQKDYAQAVAKVFGDNTVTSIDNQNNTSEYIKKPNLIFAEAGTGIGKTIGYLSVVAAFIKKYPHNRIVISTFSKALQQQIFNEIASNAQNLDVFNNVTVIQGVHNYVCLLNIEYTVIHSTEAKNFPVFWGFILRWLQETTNGNPLYGDLLPWISKIILPHIISNILNKPEECLYRKCNFYKQCFVTKIQERVKTSNVIISNHRLTLQNKFNSKYFIFDEAHTLYQVSDEIFSQEISYIKGINLKNWLIGYVTSTKRNNSLLNGFQTKIMNLLYSIKNSDMYRDNSHYEDIYHSVEKLINTLIYSSNFLPSEEFLHHLEVNQPTGVFEEFLYSVYQYVKLHHTEEFFTIESLPKDLNLKFKNIIYILSLQLKAMLQVANNLMQKLVSILDLILNEDKSKIENLISSFDLNCIQTINEFINLLQEFDTNVKNYIYRFCIIKDKGNITNIGLFKNSINPLTLFSNNFLPNKYGLVFTSATLFNSKNGISSEDLLNKYGISQQDIGVIYSIQLNSPFNYVQNSKVIILKTCNSQDKYKKNDALLKLIIAVKGGVLVLFTSIERLENHYDMLLTHKILQDNSIGILKTHSQNNYSNYLAISLFKQNIDSCLLGSDSCRDGIDIPGKSLRMVIYEKVPWMTNNILNRARRNFYGKDFEDENIILKLKQSFGRIIRTRDDRGIFVLLNPSLPKRFLSAFPQDVEIYKVTLEEAIKISEKFFHDC